MVELTELVQLILGFISIIAVIVAVFRWKINQIKQNAKEGVSSQRDIQSNQHHINQINEDFVSMQIRISNMEKDLARLQGEFSQHVREQKK